MFVLLGARKPAMFLWKSLVHYVPPQLGLTSKPWPWVQWQNWGHGKEVALHNEKMAKEWANMFGALTSKNIIVWALKWQWQVKSL